MNENIKVNGYAIASMIIGIISCVDILLGFIAPTFFLLAFPLSIVGLCLANKAKKFGDVSGQRTAGFVTSVVALCFSGFIVLLLIFALLVGISIALQGGLQNEVCKL